MKTIKIESIGHEPIFLNVPEGAKVSIEDGLTIVEPEFKEGDILFDVKDKWVYIYKSIKSECKHNHYCALSVESGFIDLDEDCYLEVYGNVRHATESEKQILFDALAKAGKAWDADKKEIVDLKYVPKVGDCVKIDFVTFTGFAYLSKIEKGKNYYYAMVDSDNFLTINDWYDSNWDCTKITPEELQAEFNKIGYEYDFETHTAKKLRWKPEIGESYFTTNGFNDIICHKWINDNTDNIYYNLCKCFKTEADAQKYKEYILKYHEQNN